MTLTAGYQMGPFEKVLSALGDRVVTASETDATARCPAHDDRNPSFSLKSGQNGKALLYCYTGCSLEDILRSLGLTMKDLFPTDGERDVARLQQAITGRGNGAPGQQAVRKKSGRSGSVVHVTMDP